jgi:hypothetical protein
VRDIFGHCREIDHRYTMEWHFPSQFENPGNASLAAEFTVRNKSACCMHAVFALRQGLEARACALGNSAADRLYICHRLHSSIIIDIGTKSDGHRVGQAQSHSPAMIRYRSIARTHRTITVIVLTITEL